MANYTLKINKTLPNADVLYDCAIDSDLISINTTNEYAIATIKSGGKVKYTVVAEGYEAVSNTLTMNKDYELTPELKKWVTLTINPEPKDSKVEIVFNNKTYKENSVKVLTKTPIKYTVSRERRETVSDTVILTDDLTIDVKLIVRIETDKDIGEYEGKTTDRLSEINLIDSDTYEGLSDFEKSKYVKYSLPSILFAFTGYNSSINDALVDLYWSLPIVSKLSPFTNGTLGNAGSSFIDYVSQLNSIMASADGAISSLKGMRRALRKVGLSGLIDVGMTLFNLIGGLGGIVYGLLFNPDLFIKAAQQMFNNIDPNDLFNRTVGSTIPNIDYAQGLLNRMYIPDGSLKDTIYGEMQQISAGADLAIDVFSQLKGLELSTNVLSNSEEALVNAIEMIASMGVSMGIRELARKMRIDYEKLADNMNNNQLADAANVIEANLDKIVNGTEEKYIKIDDLDYLNEINKNNSTSSTLIQDYQKGYEDGIKNGESGMTQEEFEGLLKKIKNEYDKLNKDSSSYIAGLTIGYNVGQQKYLEELKGVENKLQSDSYQKGYEDGYEFMKSVRVKAINQLADEGITEPTEEQISLKITSLIKSERVRVETKTEKDVPAGYINPYYSRGWNDGVDARDKVNKGITDSIIDNKTGNDEGYAYARDNIVIDEDDHQYSEKYGEPDNDINKDGREYTIKDWLLNYKEKNPGNYEYRCQGVVSGYNKYQSEYNLGYSLGWDSSLRPEDYDGEGIYYKNGEYKIITGSKAIIDNKVYNNIDEGNFFVALKVSDSSINFGYIKGWSKNINTNAYNFDNEKIGRITANGKILNDDDQEIGNISEEKCKLFYTTIIENNIPTDKLSGWINADGVIYNKDESLNNLYIDKNIIKDEDGTIHNENGKIFGKLDENDNILDSNNNIIVNFFLLRSFICDRDNNDDIIGYIDSDYKLYTKNNVIIGKTGMIYDHYLIYNNNHVIGYGREVVKVYDINGNLLGLLSRDENTYNYCIIDTNTKNRLYNINSITDNNYLIYKNNQEKEIIGYTKSKNTFRDKVYDISESKNVIGNIYYEDKAVVDLSNNFLGIFTITGDKFYEYTSMDSSIKKDKAVLDENNNIVDINISSDIDILKENFLKSICVSYKLNYEEEIAKDIYHQYSVFRGANMGWDQYYSGIALPRYRVSIIDQI